MGSRLFFSASRFYSSIPLMPGKRTSRPGLSGLDLQLKLRDGGIPTPIIFITGHGDIPMSVRAMKEGAHEFLTKPVRGQDLLDAVHKAIASDRLLRQERRESKAIRERFDSLTPREKEVLELVVAGLLNKQIADQLKNERANRQDSSRARHGKNSGRVPGPSRPHGGKTQECPSEVRTHLILMRGTSQKYTFDGIAFEGLPAIKSSRSMPLGESEPAKARRRPPALRPWLSRERPSRSVASDSEVISALA